MIEQPNATVLERLLSPIGECLTPEVAKKISDLRADTATQARIDELAAKANDGSLSEAESAEYEAFVEAIDLVSVLQEKARGVLDSQPA